MALTRRRALLASLGLAAAPYLARIEGLADALEGIAPAETIPAGTPIAVMRGTGAYFRVGDILRNDQTGENMLVQAIESDTLTVVRGLGAVREAAISRRDGIIRIGNVLPMPAAADPLDWAVKDLVPRYTQVV